MRGDRHVSNVRGSIGKYRANKNEVTMILEDVVHIVYAETDSARETLHDGTWVRAVDGKYTMKCPFKQVIPTEDIIGITVDGKRLYFR